MNNKNVNIAIAVMLFALLTHEIYIQEQIKAELRIQVVLTGRVEYQKGYIEGWHDGRKPIKIDTVYYVDTVLMDSFIIEDNVGTQFMTISNNKKRLNFNLE